MSPGYSKWKSAGSLGRSGARSIAAGYGNDFSGLSREELSSGNATILKSLRLAFVLVSCFLAHFFFFFYFFIEKAGLWPSRFCWLCIGSFGAIVASHFLQFGI